MEKIMTHKIAVVGGTGPQGRGLAYRLAQAGHAITIGSRDAARAGEKAQEIAAKIEGPTTVIGATNAQAVATSDIVLLAVPWEGHAELVTSLKDELRGKTIISCVNPLGFDAAGPYGLTLSESAAEEAQRLVPEAAVVGSFHHVAALSLWKNEGLLSHEDILVCGDDAEAKEHGHGPRRRRHRQAGHRCRRPAAGPAARTAHRGADQRQQELQDPLGPCHHRHQGARMSREEQPLIIEERGRVLILTLNRPHAKNAMSLQLSEELAKAFELLDSRE